MGSNRYRQEMNTQLENSGRSKSNKSPFEGTDCFSFVAIYSIVPAYFLKHFPFSNCPPAKRQLCLAEENQHQMASAERSFSQFRVGAKAEGCKINDFEHFLTWKNVGDAVRRVLCSDSEVKSLASFHCEQEKLGDRSVLPCSLEFGRIFRES